MEHIRADLCVIGAGSGGLSIAAGASQMGASVVLIEGGEMGGDCLNTGCVPSKALLAAAAQAQCMRRGSEFGITPVAPKVSYADAMTHVRRAINTIAPHDSVERFEGLGVRVIREWATFQSPQELHAGPYSVTARRFVIATGSSPFMPPVPGLQDVPYLTNETLFDLTEPPEHLIVLGGGPVGMEMAQAHRRLGCKVTVLEAATILNGEDPDMARIVRDALAIEGVEIRENASVVSVRGEAGDIIVNVGGEEISGSHLLIAAGRIPSVDRLDLGAAAVDFARKGVGVSHGLRTSNHRIYAVGDVTGRMQFTHAAGYDAGVAARAILFGLPARARKEHIPRATYTDPGLAQIGLTEAEARKQFGDKIEVIELGLEANDRAVAEGKTNGRVKLMVRRGRPIGVSIVGPQAGELIAPWALMMASKMKLGALARTVLPYPTFGEINKRAAGVYFSPRLFDSDWVKKVVGFVQRRIP